MLTLQDIIEQHLGVTASDISPESSFVDDFGVDSLDALDLMNAVNENFQINIEFEEMSQVETVADLEKLIAKKQSTQ